MTKMSRRTVITAGAVLTGAALNPPLGLADFGGDTRPAIRGPIHLLVNEREYALNMDNRTTVLDALREHVLSCQRSHVVQRIDGIAKVTGAARYPSDEFVASPAYAYLVVSTIARGRIDAIDAKDARAVPGRDRHLHP